MILLNDIVSIKISDTYLVLYISLSLFYLSYKGLWAIFHLFEYYFTWLRLLHSRLLQKGIYHVLCVIHISLSLSLSLNRGVYPLWSGSYPPLSLIISFPLSVFLILPFTLSYTHCERAGECVPVRPVRVPPHTLSLTHPSVCRMESRLVCPRGLIRIPVSLFPRQGWGCRIISEIMSYFNIYLSLVCPSFSLTHWIKHTILCVEWRAGWCVPGRLVRVPLHGIQRQREVSYFPDSQVWIPIRHLKRLGYGLMIIYSLVWNQNSFNFF